ncbi:MAG: gluconolactonase [Betaproteobacteria bacterium RIFCSPLOWO2_12_FULL_65_14]|nr:MAG: gluconolactonase [Betaproteobacteria bacterium RIFCSPLOWO2_12_FULL_65_14]
MSSEIRDSRFVEVVGQSISFEKVATGFLFTEGPLWHTRDQYLLFSDMPGDHLRKWSPREGVSTFRKPSNQSNGLAWDLQGRLLACEHSTSRLTRTEADGRITVLASHYRGKELNSPNDVVVRSDGSIYFTDPTYGRAEYYGRPRECELAFRGVYRLQPDTGALELLADDFGQPNGLCFSADGKRLFVNDTEKQHIRVFDMRQDGTLANGKEWARTVGEGDGGPDGMKIDSQSNLYSCGPGGIHVFEPGGTCLGVIRVPEYTANFAWGDADRRSLYITASTSLYRIRTRVPGRSQMD